MLDKAWVHLCRLDPDHAIGAWKFVQNVSANQVDNQLIICPCIDCRNLARHSCGEVVAHLVTRGMDEVYKLRNDWYHHGECNSVLEAARKVTQFNEEIVGLYRAVGYEDDEFDNGDDFYETEEVEDSREDAFMKKLADAETPLYPNCANYSKLSSIVSLFRLKTNNGCSDKSFNDLLGTLSEMLPDGNVLHTSLYDVKKFLGLLT